MTKCWLVVRSVLRKCGTLLNFKVGQRKKSAFVHETTFLCFSLGRRRKFHSALSWGPYWIVIKRLSHNNQTAPHGTTHREKRETWDWPHALLFTETSMAQPIQKEDTRKTDNYIETWPLLVSGMVVAFIARTITVLSLQMPALFSVMFPSKAWIHLFKEHHKYKILHYITTCQMSLSGLLTYLRRVKSGFK